MRHWLRVLLLAAFAAIAGTAASAEDDAQTCMNMRIDSSTAVAACNRALARNWPESARETVALLYHFRGSHLMIARDCDRAMEDFNQALARKPNHAPAFGNRGNCWYEKGDYDKALADFTSALRIDPAHLATLGHRGRPWMKKGNPTLALIDLNEGIRLAPNQAFFYQIRSAARRMNKDLDGAIADADEAIRLQPKLGEAYHSRSLALYQKGNRARALQDIEEAIRLEPNKVTHQTHRNLLLANAAPAASPPVASIPSGSERRIALVIGNSDYRSVGPLANPRRDAAAVADTLRRSGFQTVTVINDLTRGKMVEALRSFAAASEKADWSVVYYAGHGIEIGGQNYVVPVDAGLRTDRDAQFEAVPMEQLIAATEGARKLRLLLLDACRENPFINQMQRTVASRSIGRGLAQVEPDAGMLVVFAAKHGQVAYDGEGGNSPFVSALLRRMQTPKLEIRKLFDLVRDDVMVATARKQQPFSYGSVPGSEDFYFTR
jgi:tetratricopeptide (TPR) repeat protein